MREEHELCLVAEIDVSTPNGPRRGKSKHYENLMWPVRTWIHVCPVSGRMHQFFLSKCGRTSTTTLLIVIPMLGFRSSIAVAQQSLFNVPSANVTPKGELFFQEQLNFGTAGESNLTTDIGLGKGFEVGLNVVLCRSEACGHGSGQRSIGAYR